MSADGASRLVFYGESGFKKRVVNSLVLLSECANGTALKTKITSPLIKQVGERFISRYMTQNQSAYLLTNLYLIRSLVARTYRTRRMARGFPARGQRRWSHGDSAKFNHLFFKNSVLAYERDLWNLTTKKRFKWSKLYEMRQKARVKVKKVKAKGKKIKSRGDLARRKKKKSVWK